MFAKFNSKKLFKKRFPFFLPLYPHLPSQFVKNDNRTPQIKKCNMGIKKRRIWCWLRIRWRSSLYISLAEFFKYGFELSINFCVLWHPYRLSEKNFFAYICIFAYCILQPKSDKTAQSNKNVRSGRLHFIKQNKIVVSSAQSHGYVVH
jgi:hypothetical protein